MHKISRIIVVVIALACMLQISVSAANTQNTDVTTQAAEIAGESDKPYERITMNGSANKDLISIIINGKKIQTKGKVYVEDGTVYVPVVEMAVAFGVNAIRWQNDATTLEVESDELLLRITADSTYIEANGRYIHVPTGCHAENYTMMVPLEPLCTAFGAFIMWKEAESEILITTGSEPIQSAEEFYDETDLYWLSRIISAEARGESFEGKLAVGNVVMNRKESYLFPDTVKGVIFDRRFGIQFSPAYSGAIYCTPDESCIMAAKLALEGVNVVGESLYFSPARFATTSWAARNRGYFGRIGNHAFFL